MIAFVKLVQVEEERRRQILQKKRKGSLFFSHYNTIFVNEQKRRERESQEDGDTDELSCVSNKRVLRAKHTLLNSVYWRSTP